MVFFDFLRVHQNCISKEWDGGWNNSPCANFNDVQILSKTSVSRNQSASSGGKRKGSLNVLLDVYEKGTTNHLFSYTTNSLAASWMALYNPMYVREVTGNDQRLRVIWMRASGESFLNIYSSAHTGTDWMASIADTTTLAEIAIPGTHDSGAFDSSRACECQSDSPIQQLESGVRSFDFRIVCTTIKTGTDELYLVHGDIGGFGCTFDYAHVVRDYLEGFRDFLKEHPTETIMIHVKKESDADCITLYTYVCYDCSQEVGLVLGDLLVEMEASGLQIIKDYDTFPTLGDARGKVLIFHEPSVADCCDYPIALDWSSETMRQEVHWGDSGAKFIIQDAYKNTSSHKWDIVEGLLAEASQHTDPQALYYNYTSCVAPGAPNPAGEAENINEWLATWLSRNPKSAGLGCIIADYINCAGFAGTGVTWYCNYGGYDLLPFMIYSTNF